MHVCTECLYVYSEYFVVLLLGQTVGSLLVCLGRGRSILKGELFIWLVCSGCHSPTCSCSLGMRGGYILVSHTSC